MTLLYPSFLWLFIPIVLFFISQKQKNLLVVTHLLILALIIVTLSRPVIEEGLQESSIEAKDIIIAMDVSFSMKAKDIAPTRYDFAKETIDAFLASNTKDNIMLVAFTSNPLLLSPPTTDHVLISQALQSLRPEYILTKGTSLKKLFEKLSSMSHTDKTLILMTDGGEEISAKILAEQLQQSSLSLITLALGTTQGSTIEKEDGTLLKDKEQNLVISRINPMLEQLTSLLNGTYLTPSATAQATADALQSALDAHKKQNQEIKKMQYHYTELYQIPLFIALILFLVLHTRASRYLFILFAFLGIQLQASIWDAYYLHKAYNAYEVKDFNKTKKVLKQVDVPSLQSQFALANTYYRMQNYKKAIALYQSIHTTHAKIKQKLFYNIANAHTMLQAYDKAKLYYTKALQLGKDEDSLHNLKLVALLKQHKDAGLGISHPKSQNSDTSKSMSQESKEEKTQSHNEDQPSSGSGSGGESKEKKNNEEEKKRLKMDKEVQAQPLSSKVYELINEGYIRETQPW